jgi:hypothetical protein
MKKALLFLCVLLAHMVQAQPRCGFDQVNQRMLQQNAAYSSAVAQMNSQWAQQMASSSMSQITTTPTGVVYEIPVVIHVIHTGGAIGSIYNPTDAQLQGMIAYLNQAYNATYASYPDTNNGGVYFPVKFVLAKRSPTCSSTTGINRVDGSSVANYTLKGIKLNNASGADEVTVKALSKWSNTEYYNIWVVNKIDSNDGTFGTFTAGYAYLPPAGSDVDGCVMLATQAIAGAITLPHEIAHSFGIYHTFEGDNGGSTCPTNNNCNTDGDLICDTDPEKRSTFNCPSGINPCTGTGYNFVQHNFMDYSNCQDRFTAGQRTRWLNTMMTQRPGLMTSLGGVAPSGSITAANCVTTIAAANASNNANIGPCKIDVQGTTSVNKELSFVSHGYSLENNQAYIDRSCWYRADLVAGNTYNISITTETNRQNVAAYIDYNNDGIFTSGELVFSHSGTQSTNETHSGQFTVPTSSITTCTTLRMRVLADYYTVSLPSNACGTLQYGQAEDYSVYIKPASAVITVSNALTSGSNPSCTGSSLTFTATPSATPTSPTYTWYVGNTAVSNGTTYTTSTITNNSYVSVKLNYTSACGSDSAISNIMLVQRVTSIAPTISINANPGNAICSGTSVTFTASTTNGGTSPAYQWKLNGNNITGATSSTYTTSTLANGDVISCQLTSNASCANPATVLSNNITMSVTASVTPSVTIGANPGSTVCAGSSVTFTATPTNGGSSPSYQWQKNGVNISGATSVTYTTSTLATNDVIRVIMTSSSACAIPSSATSAGITMTVNPVTTPSVTTSANPGNNICAGTSVTFTATPVNGGSNPSFQWKINGSNVTGATSSTYTTSTLASGNLVTVTMTSSDACASPSSATSTAITMTVNPINTPSVSIAANPGNTICTGTNVTFTATPTNGGATPAYQWQKNGVNISGATSSAYSTTTLVNGDVITVNMTSSTACSVPSPVTSNSITMSVSSTLVPTATVSASPSATICVGMSITFTANITNGGTTPAYQWKKNGSNIVGATSSTYTTSTLANGDQFSVQLTSSYSCASPNPVTSSPVTVIIAGSLTASVSIAASTGTSICTGTSVTFTATPTNGGNTPAYQWKKNGVNIGGATNVTYTTNTLANNDVISCQLTTSASCATPTITQSNNITMTVTPPATPSVSIAANPGNNICTGTSVTFTATPTNGGTAPTYQWLLNGTNIIGATNPTYTTNTLANSDVVTVSMVSNGVCVSTTPVTGNAITMSVNSVVPTVSISANPSNTVCAGSFITFTSAQTNGGTTPTYQWQKNGVNITGATSSSYATNTMVTGDVFRVIMTSNANCAIPATATSNSVTTIVNPLITPTITISSSTGSSVCLGGTVTFSSSITNGGSAQAYQWKKNGVNIAGATSPTYTTNNLLIGNVITCDLTITAACPNPATVTSNALALTITQPSVSVTVSPNDTICSITPAIFTVNATSVGNNPSYQWKKNGVDITGATASTYIVPMAKLGDVITTRLVSSDNCVSAPVPASNSITMFVEQSTIPLVTISVSPDTNVNEGDKATFTGITNVQGMTYQWRLNNFDIAGATAATYTTDSLKQGDSISLFISTTDSCVKPNYAVSNFIRMHVVVGIQGIKEVFNDIHLSPNPNNGDFRIHGTLKPGVDTRNASVEVLNAVGAVIYKAPIDVQGSRIDEQLHVSDRVSSGLYMVRLNIGGYSQMIRFIAQQ